MALVISVKVPVAVAEEVHCQVRLPIVPSSSLSDATSAVSTRGGSSLVRATVPASSSLLTSMVTAMVASAVPSLTFTVTE